ncbi:MAG: SdpI family protein [Anaerolineae bacterium]|nr:SdpI family protein [Anaerolineae bacterium]
MSTSTTTIFVLLMIIGATIAGLLLWDRLPDQMASHWNINDQVDGYMPKFWGVFMVPLITLGMFVLFLVIPSIDPLKANIAQFREAFNLFIVLMVAFMLYIYGLTLAWSLGYTGFRMSSSILPAIGLLFIFIGFMLRQAKRNFFIGIRTPWTLSSDRVWDKTHQIGSTLFIVAGALAVIGSFFGGTTAFWMLMVPIFGSTIFLVVYSYVLYKQETNV